MLLRGDVREGQYCISSSALMYGTEDCRIPSFSHMQRSCRATKGQAPCELISSSKEQLGKNREALTLGQWLVTTGDIPCCDVMIHGSNGLVTAWSRGRRMRETVSLRLFLGLMLGETVYISRVTSTSFHVALLEQITILVREWKKLSWKNLCGEVMFIQNHEHCSSSQFVTEGKS